MQEGNLFSYVALFGWVPVSVWLYARYRPETATAVTLLGAVLLLPERVAVDLPVIPELDKYSVGALCALVGCLWKCRSRLSSARIGRGVDGLWIALLVGQ